MSDVPPLPSRDDSQEDYIEIVIEPSDDQTESLSDNTHDDKDVFETRHDGLDDEQEQIPETCAFADAIFYGVSTVYEFTVLSLSRIGNSYKSWSAKNHSVDISLSQKRPSQNLVAEPPSSPSIELLPSIHGTNSIYSNSLSKRSGAGRKSVLSDDTNLPTDSVSSPSPSSESVITGVDDRAPVKEPSTASRISKLSANRYRSDQNDRLVSNEYSRGVYEVRSISSASPLL